MILFIQIDEDMQRHNELLEVIKASPSEISEIVARRRKDFTKEFFVHLHTVAESYYDNPTEQNGKTERDDFFLKKKTFLDDYFYEFLVDASLYYMPEKINKC